MIYLFETLYNPPVLFERIAYQQSFVPTGPYFLPGMMILPSTSQPKIKLSPAYQLIDSKFYPAYYEYVDIDRHK